MRSDAWRLGGNGSSRFILEIMSANSLAYPGICETSNWAWTADDRRQSFSTKKHKGALVVNREFEVDSAAVLSLRLFKVSAKRWDGNKLQREYKRQIWANVS